jgi:hypothetical protein
MSGACDASPEGARRSRDHRGWSAGVATVSGDEHSETLAEGKLQTARPLNDRFQSCRAMMRVARLLNPRCSRRLHGGGNSHNWNQR